MAFGWEKTSALEPGDRVTAYLVLPAFCPEIVYEDEGLLALFKPTGLPSVGPGYP